MSKQSKDISDLEQINLRRPEERAWGFGSAPERNGVADSVQKGSWDPGASFGACGPHGAPLRLFTLKELRDLPKPGWLVDGILPSNSLGVLYGPPESGKTFVALDLAKRVVLGEEWCGQKARRGPVVYVAAEGSNHFSLRAEAFSKGCDQEALAALDRDLHVLREPVQLVSEGPGRLLEAIEAKGVAPVLIVIDTLARCFEGEDENSAQSMGLFVAGCGNLQRETGALVLVAHHSLKSGAKLERGSSALRGAADVMLLLSKSGDTITMTCEKMKDAAHPASVRFRLEQVDLRVGQLGEPQTSCRVVESDAELAHPVDASPDAPPRHKDVILALLDENAPERFTQVQVIERTRIPKTSTSTGLAALVASGSVSLCGKGKGALYYREIGEDLQVPLLEVPQVPPSSDGTSGPSSGPGSTTPLRGGDMEHGEVSP